MKLLARADTVREIPHGVETETDHGARLRIVLAGPDLAHVSLVRREGRRLDRTWTIAPNGLEPPDEGRARDALDGFSPPPTHVAQEDGVVTLAGGDIAVAIRANPLHLAFHRAGESAPFASDRPSGAYMLSRRTNAFAHHMARRPSERHYGLGDKAGPVDRTGRRFRLEAVDPCGYDAETSDPLYKVAPILICDDRETGAAYGILYDNLAAADLDLGATIDNYHAPFRSYRAEDGDLDYWVVLGPSVLDVARRIDKLVGGQALPPKWALGFGLTSMSIADAPDADARIREIVADFARHDLPCDSFHFGSGYTLHGGRRHTFRWNETKFPDPAGTLAALHEAGLRTVTNIKPCLLDDHPDYGPAADAGILVKDGDGADAPPAVSLFWDGPGAHLDFTNPDGVAWWRGRMRERLLGIGVDTIWNDNNEYEIWDEDARCAGFGRPFDLALARPLQPLLMTRASFREQQEVAPGRRPYAITRAGGPGIGRYGQSWTGDNTTAWKTLRWNIAQGLSMGLSAMGNTGHDVGGFLGQEPTPELLVRFTEMCSLWPRMVMNSWKSSGVTTLPWMYPEVVPQMREAMRLRYRLMPYLYTAMWRAAVDGTPAVKPLFTLFADDPLVGTRDDLFLLGDDLLVAPVLAEGEIRRAVPLPAGTAWIDFHTGARVEGGREVEVEAPLGRLPVLVREGALIPLSRQLARIDPARETWRGLRVHPGTDGASETVLYEDNGETADWRGDGACLIRVAMRVEGERLSLEARREGAFRPAYEALEIEIAGGRRFGEIVLNGAPAAPGAPLHLAVDA
ncbi:TIM-barrel domain-containing protein [Salinarimonas rosea]|uniref:glycoside hydrolase family 31 protein n=1 Tax=Salinarimonas rosea TaxID=552063 RepID=UPI00040FCA50|nr:TIM-barrel domain-containing protein [Salinarimonas rosea]